MKKKPGLKERVEALERTLGGIEELEEKNRQNSISLEKELFRAVRLYEHKIWQLNSFTNVILYRLSLENKTERKNFKPLVSIVMPVYNGSNYLGEAIESALNQNYQKIEIIVVDDGSDDDGATEKIAKEFDGKIRYFKKKNGGVSSALNYGIKRMKGEYFSWLSHDDLIDPEHIENLVRHISFLENKGDIPFSGFRIIDEDGKVEVDKTISAQLHCYDYKMSVLYNEMSLLQGEINGGSVLIPKKAFYECGGFDEQQLVTQERDMWYRMMNKGYHFVNIPFDTALIREHDHSVTQNNSMVAQQSNLKRLEIIKKVPDEVKRKFCGSEEAFYDFQKRFLESNGLYEVAEML